ncbi:MAG: ABC transporter substrate-binding protein [Bacteroidales bacterium]|nr:ABC transporter substrate-binding protein [Bacteroidales bacterium]
MIKLFQLQSSYLNVFINMSMNKTLIIFLIIFFCFSCSRNIDSENSKTVFKYNEASGISSLDPAFAVNQANIWGVNQLFNGLVQLDEKLEPKPCIAKSWNISDDGLTYTFNLRNDVFFHDNDAFENGKGRKVIADDFVYSFNRLLDPNVASPGAWIFNNVSNHQIPDSKKKIYSFKALNDSCLTLKLKHPFPPFLGLLSMQYCSVIPHEAVKKYGKDFRRNPVGTGPFKFKMWKEGVKLVYLKNENYFEKSDNEQLPFLDAVSITFLIDKQSAFLEFIKGKIDFMSGIDASYKDELLTKRGELNPKYKNKFKLISQPYLNTEYLGIMVDTTKSDFKDNPLIHKAIRKAINYGFDRKKMLRYLRNNIGTPGNYGMIPLGLPSFDSTKMFGYSYNPDKSRQLLIEAGFLDLDSLPEITLTTNSEYLDLCKYIQHQLGEIGISININVNPPASLKELKAQTKLPFFRASWIADYADAENYLSLFNSKNFCPNGPNYTHFANKEFDKLYENAQFQVNDSLRYIQYQKMSNLIMEESPVIILYYDRVLRFLQNNIYGLESNAMNLLTLKNVKKSK